MNLILIRKPDRLLPLLHRFFLSDRAAAYWRRFLQIFFTVLILCLVHRMIATRMYYIHVFRPTYNPEGYLQIAQSMWNAHGPSQLLGILSDVLFAGIAASIAALPIFKRWMRFVALAILIVFLAANYEHIKYNHTHINLLTIIHAADWTFVAGQTTSGLLKIFAVLCVFGAILPFVFRIRAIHWVVGAIMVPLFAFVFLGAGTYNYLQPDWMQRHPLMPSAGVSTATTDPRAFPDIIRVTPAEVTASQTQHNVLVIYMEGLSTKSLELGRMENLSLLAANNITFSRYFGSQIVTANGLYAALTGDYPYYLSTEFKWDHISSDNPIFRDALPAQLRNSGYQTSFIQSAPLGFMNKDDILPQLGFSDVKGRTSWTDSYSSDVWGIDDRALFEHVLDHVDIQDPDSPWYVSVLTTGTHSPYNTPDDFLSDFTLERYKAIAYLDFAIGELMQGLEDRGLLDNTVVIFTADESRERSFESPVLDGILLHWLPMVIVHPSKLPHDFDFYLSANMFPRLLPELLGPVDNDRLAALEQPEQPIIFGNPYSRKFFWFDPQGDEFLMCGMPDFECAVFEETEDILALSTRLPDRFVHFPDLERMVRQLDSSK